MGNRPPCAAGPALAGPAGFVARGRPRRRVALAIRLHTDLDRTAFYVTGGGQAHDTGILRWEGGEAPVVDVYKKGDGAWHTLEGDVPTAGTEVHGEIDLDPRCALHLGQGGHRW